MDNEKSVQMPMIGDDFPKITIQTTRGRMNLPTDMSGKWFVLFSHPADFTPVCTTEFVAFARKQEEFRKLNCELIGLSIDQVFSHLKWIEWMKEKLDIVIDYPIIADHAGTLARALGMVHPKKGFNTVRAVFVVDPKGKIRLMFYYPQELGRNIEEILRAVRGLLMADKHKVAMPANWPNNDIVGDKVIMPPATDEKTMKERMAGGKDFVCYDWWFCAKDIKK